MSFLGFPVLPDLVASSSMDIESIALAADIDGPTYTCMPRSLTIDRDMKVIDLLQQMTHGIARLDEDSQLPMFALHRALNEGDKGAPLKCRDGDAMANDMRHLNTNWL